jgi:hypothetical protein
MVYNTNMRMKSCPCVVFVLKYSFNDSTLILFDFFHLYLSNKPVTCLLGASLISGPVHGRSSMCSTSLISSLTLLPWIMNSSVSTSKLSAISLHRSRRISNSFSLSKEPNPTSLIALFWSSLNLLRMFTSFFCEHLQVP